MKMNKGREEREDHKKTKTDKIKGGEGRKKLGK
jgi:hypothetical protein